MKLNFIVALATVLMVGTASAQHVNIGIKGGLNLYNLHYKNSSLDSKFGLHAGLLGHIHVTEKFSLQPEIVYSNQGAQYTKGSMNSRFNMNYVNVPLLFQYMFGSGFRLQAGPQLGLLVKANSRYNNEVTVNQTDNFKTIDTAISLGAGYIAKSGLGVDFRYNHGLSNIHKSSNSAYTTNRGFQLGMFYLLNHKS
ncbi:MAG: PorT family protein [Bacteroidetes bacterium]|nr:PorT family protein [Bacteroidota bacterium]